MEEWELPVPSISRIRRESWTRSNTVPGARVGLNGEYRIFAGIGIVGDLCVEAYTDAYNGFVAGQRPFDLRALGSVGIIVHL